MKINKRDTYDPAKGPTKAQQYRAAMRSATKFASLTKQDQVELAPWLKNITQGHYERKRDAVDAIRSNGEYWTDSNNVSLAQSFVLNNWHIIAPKNCQRF